MSRSTLGPTHVRVAVLCGICLLADGYDVGIFGAVVPSLIRDWHLSGTLAGLLGTASLAGMLVGAIVLGAAADRVGLGTCPISAIRNHAQQVSDILSLPAHVFPVAALGGAYVPKEGVYVAMFLMLAVVSLLGYVINGLFIVPKQLRHQSARLEDLIAAEDSLETGIPAVPGITEPPIADGLV